MPPPSTTLNNKERHHGDLINAQPCAKKKMSSDSKRKGRRRHKICNSADSLAGIEQDDDSYAAVEEELTGSSSTLAGKGLEDSDGTYSLQPLSQGPAKTVPSSPEEQAQMLVELIAREMAAAFLRQKSASSLLSVSRSSESADDSSNLSSSAVGAIAEMVVCSVRDGQVRAGGDLEQTVQLLLKQKQGGTGVPSGEKSSATYSLDARSDPDGTAETEVSGSNSDLLPADPAAAHGAKDLNGSSSDEIVWTPEAVVESTNRCPRTEKLEIPLFPIATKAKTNNDQSRASEVFEPRTWTAGDFGSKKAIRSDLSPPAMIDPDDEIESDDYDADDLDLDAEEDDVSVMSDITGLTGAFDGAREAKWKDVQVEVKEKEDKAKFTLTDSDSFKAFAGNVRAVLSSTTYEPLSVRNLTIRKKAAKKATSPPTPKAKVSVSFTHVQIRHYERIMSDNPASAAGPSIGIGWKFVEADPVCVDTFEKRERPRERILTDLQLSKATRLKLVRALGYTDREIAANVRDLNKSRSNRKQTVDNLGVEKVEEAMEKVKRKVRRLFSLQRQPSVSSLDSTKTPSIEIDRVSI
jgi:predicted XRE-type DNA-binding protein